MEIKNENFEYLVERLIEITNNAKEKQNSAIKMYIQSVVEQFGTKLENKRVMDFKLDKTNQVCRQDTLWQGIKYNTQAKYTPLELYGVRQNNKPISVKVSYLDDKTLIAIYYSIKKQLCIKKLVCLKNFL